MYTYRDTVAGASPADSLPVEACTYNGSCLDEVVPFFRTLYVSGRELLSKEVSTYSVADNDYFKSAKYPPRTITVGYAIMAKADAQHSAEQNFRRAYNVLNGVLAAEQAMLQFADEPNFYFIATKAENSEVEAGRNSVVGEITFTCTDPLKYSTEVKTVTATHTSGKAYSRLNFNYEGTAPAPIDYEINVNGDVGYFGIVSADGAMQYGYKDEVDKAPVESSETLLRATSGAAVKSALANTNGSSLEFTKYATAFITKTIDGVVFMTPSTSYGTGAQWHGYAGTYSTPSGKSAANMHVQTRVLFEATDYDSVGLMDLALNAGGVTIADLLLTKDTIGNNQGRALCRVKGTQYKDITYNMSGSGAPFARSFDQRGTLVSITKNGANLLFNVAGTTFSINVPELKSTKIDSVTLWACQWSDYTPVAYMGYQTLQVRADGVTVYKDVPNRYGEGDVLKINGAEQRLYVNGLPRYGDEITGTKYFKTKAGANEIKVGWSTWATSVPTIVAKFREAYY